MGAEGEKTITAAGVKVSPGNSKNSVYTYHNSYKLFVLHPVRKHNIYLYYTTRLYSAYL